MKGKTRGSGKCKAMNASESNEKKKKRVAACPNSSELYSKSLLLLFHLKISINLYIHT